MRPPVVLSRCDRLGDLILSLPSLGFLRDMAVTRRILHCSPYAADVGRWAMVNGLCEELWVAGEAPPHKLRDALGLCLQLSPASAADFRRAGLTQTLAPRTKLSALWQFKKTIAQHRSRVEKSEMEYNLDLVRGLAAWQNWECPPFRGLPALRIPDDWRAPRPSPDVVFVVANRGSARDWPLDRYVERARSYRSGTVDFLVAGDGADEKIAALREAGISQIVPTFARVRELIAYIGRAGRVVSSSTGPLHIAFAAGVPVYGIYPGERLQSFARWRPHGYWHAAPAEFTEI